MASPKLKKFGSVMKGMGGLFSDDAPTEKETVLKLPTAKKKRFGQALQGFSKGMKKFSSVTD